MNGVKQYGVPYCDVLAWCLMPNYFHFLIHANACSVAIIKDGSFGRQQFSQSIKQLLSSYAKAINKQEKRTGSLFQQKTKASCVTEGKTRYEQIAFHYIHQNPIKAKLVSKMEDWKYSSFRDYLDSEKETICNKALAIQRLDINASNFYGDSYQVVNYVTYTSEV